MCTENYHWHHDYVRLAWDSGFCFDLHKSKSNFDWNSIGLVDIDRVSRDRDIAVVEKHMATVLHFCLDEDQTKILDPTFVKVFRLSQLSVQYLQFCKRYLDNTLVLLKKQLTKQNEENLNLKEHCDKLESEVIDFKKKLKDLKLLQCQPVISETGGSLKCSDCSKVFLTQEFLMAHIKRRHAAKDVNPLQKETDKLQLEIKELKERLNSAEKYVQDDHMLSSIQSKPVIAPSNGVLKDNIQVNILQDKFEQLKDHVEKELNTLRDQKQYHEKYDKWFELVFQRLDNSRKELLDKNDKVINDNNVVGDGDKIYTKENTTQTVVEHLKCVNGTETIGQNLPDTKILIKDAEPDLNLVHKIQEDIRINTESHLDQIQDVLQQKLTGGLEQIQTQMNTFWQKINDLQNPQLPVIPPKIEIDDDVNFLNTMQAKQISERPKPAPRIMKIQNLQAELNNVETCQNMPAKQILQTYYVTGTNFSNQEDRLSPDIRCTLAIEGNTDFEQQQSETSINNALTSKLKTSNTVNEKAVRRHKVIYSKRNRGTENIKEFPVYPSNSSDGSELQALVMKPQVKPSNTSTLAQRSVTSLKQLLNDKEVQEGLKEELQDMVNLRLKEIGVSPLWSGLPQRSYARAVRIITHRAHLFAKKHPDYANIREDITNKVDAQLGLTAIIPKQKIALKAHDRVKPVIHFSRKVYQRTKARKVDNKRNHVDIDASDEVNSKISNHMKAIYNTSKELSYSTDNIDVKSTNEITSKQVKPTAAVKLQTPIKKKVLFDLETSSSIENVEKVPHLPVQHLNHLENEYLQEKENNPDIERLHNPVLTRHNIDLLIGKPRTAYKMFDTSSATSVASSVLDGSKTRAVINTKNVTQTKSANDDGSDWDISDIIT